VIGPGVMSPTTAQREVDRIVTKARAHPDKVEHWFQTLPQGSRDLLSFAMFRALVERGDGA
jgi:hypothetical protein